MAQALQGSVGHAADLVARYGGDEFALVLPETPLEGAQQVAERACQAIRNLVLTYDGNRLPGLTLSVGTATIVPNSQKSPEETIALADRTLYCAKATGRNCVKAAYLRQR